MVKISDILTDLGITYKESGQDYVVNCWHHSEKIPSMNIDKETGVFHCFSCGSAGNLFSILKQHLDISGIEALQYLGKFYDEKKNNAEERIQNFRKDIIEPRTRDRGLYKYIIKMPKCTPLRFHKYLAKRGFMVNEIQEWEMALVDSNQPIDKFQGYEGWILIPIYQNGILRNYFLRSPFSNKKRYGTYGIKDVLFGYDSAKDFSKPIYLVEGIFDMIMLRRTGVQVVASLTNRLYEEQYNKLKQYSKVIIVPDNDEPGFNLAFEAIPLLNNVPVTVCKVPNGKKDTGDCTLEELSNMIQHEIDIVDYVTGMQYASKFKKISW